MKTPTMIALLGASLLFVGCPSKPELCDEDLRAACGCDPKIQGLATNLALTGMSGAMFLEVKNCADATLNASVKDVKWVEAAFKGCISSSKKLDESIRDALLKLIDETKPSERQSDAWVACYVKSYLPEKQAPPPPLVVLMDSHLEVVVYCSDTYAKGGSNTDDIASLLASMEPRAALASVPTHLEWQDDQRVLNLNPKLVVIHASAFYKETQEISGNQRLIDFLSSMKRSQAKVLVYTRGLPDQPTPELMVRWDNVRKAVNDSEGRFELFVVPKGADPCFHNPLVGVPFNNKVREMLAAP